MKYLGAITDDKDLVTKKYVDDEVGKGKYTFTFTPTATGNYNSRATYTIFTDKTADEFDYTWDDIKDISAEFYGTITSDNLPIGGKAYTSYISYSINTNNKISIAYSFVFPISSFSYGGTTYYPSIVTGTTVVVRSSINIEGTLTVTSGM